MARAPARRAARAELAWARSAFLRRSPDPVSSRSRLDRPPSAGTLIQRSSPQPRSPGCALAYHRKPPLASGASRWCPNPARSWCRRATRSRSRPGPATRPASPTPPIARPAPPSSPTAPRWSAAPISCSRSAPPAAGRGAAGSGAGRDLSRLPHAAAQSRRGPGAGRAQDHRLLHRRDPADHPGPVDGHAVLDGQHRRLQGRAARRHRAQQVLPDVHDRGGHGAAGQGVRDRGRRGRASRPSPPPSGSAPT